MHSPSDSIVDTLNNFVTNKFNDIFTAIPARVTAVNLDNNSVDVQPLIRRKFSDNKNLTSPELYDVPFMILSAGNGKFKITMPIQIDDTVLVLFSQRDLMGFHESDGKTLVNSLSVIPLGSNPILAIPCLYTEAGATEVKDSEINIEAGSAKLSFKEDGDVVMDLGSNTFRVNGNVAFNGDSLTHNGISIGDEHQHSNVESGPSNTGGPV